MENRKLAVDGKKTFKAKFIERTKREPTNEELGAFIYGLRLGYTAARHGKY